jgi:glycosyltransferase involved in cell wall biosynthesis
VAKICIISPAAYSLLKKDDNLQVSGGSEAQLCFLGLALKNEGHDVSFIVDDYGQNDLEIIDGLKVYKNPFRYMGGPNAYYLFDMLNLLKILGKINADFHFLKLPKDAVLPVGLFSKLFHKKLVYIGQSDKDVDFRLLFKIQNRIAVSLYRLGLYFVDHAVAQTVFQEQGFKGRGLDSTLIKNVITLPARYEKKENFVLWVGNDSLNKRPDLYVKLARILPELNFKMIVAPTRTAKNQDLYDAASVVPNLEYLGFVPFDKISKYFSRASLFVSTSLREGFPNTFLQSWQYGTPVVSLHVDPDGLIEKHNLGRHSRTFEKMCKDVEELMKDGFLRNKIGDNAKEYTEKYHSAVVIIPQYLEIIRNLTT